MSSEQRQAVQLHPELALQLKKLRETKRKFNVEEWIDKKTDMLNEYMSKCKLKALVVNVSGGIDSAVTIALARAAKVKKGSPIARIVGVAQPIKSTASIWQRALLLASEHVEVVTVDQSDIHSALQKACDEAIHISGKDFASGQLKSYMRTPVGFYVAQLLSQNGTPAIVLGTGNMDEDGYLFYFCKAGDGVSDVQLLNDLHKSEVFKVGAALGVPEPIMNAAPSADLWPGQTDENEMGFTYDFVELLLQFTRSLSPEEQEVFQKEISPEAWAQFVQLRREAESIHVRNKHKEKFPLNLNVL